MSKRHSNLTSANLGVMVEAAADLDYREEEQKAKDKAEGRRSDLDDLPTGHPLRKMMEDAKQRFEAKEQGAQQQQQQQTPPKEVKVAKKLAAVQQQQQETDNQRRNDAKDYNSAVQEVLKNMGMFGKLAQGMSANFHGDMRQRTMMTRAFRAVQAAMHAVNDSMVKG